MLLNMFLLIGVDILKRYLSIFILRSRVISMIKLSDDWKLKDKALLDGFEPLEVEILGHLPIIEVEIGNQKLNLLLDCGASSTMLNTEY